MTIQDATLNLFRLNFSQLREISRRMEEKLRRGLEAEGRELAAIPTYLSPPSPVRMAGEALVVDIGGSNVRAARVELGGPGKASFPEGSFFLSLPAAWACAEDFFRFQARLVSRLNPGKKLPLGYCFSYPACPGPDRDAVLLKWTKGLEVPGVVGGRVGKLLARALLDEGVEVGPVTVLNDAVAALLGGYWAAPPSENFQDFIGLIVGTGSNLAAAFPREALAAKLPPDTCLSGKMVVNLEAGNFHPPHLNRFDEELDRARPDAGEQRLEKAVSGKFLPELFNFVLPGRPVSDARELFELARSGSGTPGGDLARSLIERSADLVAAALAGTIAVMQPRGRVGILAEGSVIAANRSYRRRVQEVLSDLLKDRGLASAAPELLLASEVNLVGAALAARSLPA